MANPTVRVRVDDRATPALEAAKDKIRTILRNELDAGAEQLLRRLRAYPAPRSGQRYIRTNRLRDSWRKRTQASVTHPLVTVYSNSSIAPYNRYVQQRATQAWMHRGRWLTAEDIQESDARKVSDGIYARLTEALKAL